MVLKAVERRAQERFSRLGQRERREESEMDKLRSSSLHGVASLVVVGHADVVDLEDHAHHLQRILFLSANLDLD